MNNLRNQNQQNEKFPASEYQYLGEALKHTDIRTVKTIRHNITVTTVIVSAVMIFMTQNNSEDFLTISLSSFFITFILFVLYGFGFVFTLKRMTAAVLLKVEYFIALECLRGYLVNMNVKPYILLPVREETVDDEYIAFKEKEHRGKIKSYIIIAFKIWLNFLASCIGISMTLTIKYIYENLNTYSLSVENTFIILAVVIVLFYIVSNLYLSSHIKKVQKTKWEKLKLLLIKMKNIKSDQEDGISLSIARGMMGSVKKGFEKNKL